MPFRMSQFNSTMRSRKTNKLVGKHMVINFGINILNAPIKWNFMSNSWKFHPRNPHIARALVHQASLLNLMHAPQNSLRVMFGKTLGNWNWCKTRVVIISLVNTLTCLIANHTCLVLMPQCN